MTQSYLDGVFTEGDIFDFPCGQSDLRREMPVDSNVYWASDNDLEFRLR